MCGFFAVFSIDNNLINLKKKIENAGSLLNHRGPDNKGFYFDETFSICSYRLSIIDLSSEGNQPMISSDNNFVIGYINAFGKPPNKEAIRGYDVILDAILRIAFSQNLQKSLDLGETEYESNRFQYFENKNQSYLNKAFYILQHREYNIYEIKE